MGLPSVLVSKMPVNGSFEPVIGLNPQDPADPFDMYLGGNLLKNGIRAIPKIMVDEKADCVISLMPVAEPQRYGIAELSEDGKKSSGAWGSRTNRGRTWR